MLAHRQRNESQVLQRTRMIGLQFQHLCVDLRRAPELPLLIESRGSREQFRHRRGVGHHPNRFRYCLAPEPAASCSANTSAATLNAETPAGTPQ